MFNIKSGYIKLKVIYLCRGKKCLEGLEPSGFINILKCSFLFQALCTKQLFYGPSLM